VSINSSVPGESSCAASPLDVRIRPISEAPFSEMGMEEAARLSVLDVPGASLNLLGEGGEGVCLRQEIEKGLPCDDETSTAIEGHRHSIALLGCVPYKLHAGMWYDVFGIGDIGKPEQPFEAPLFLREWARLLLERDATQHPDYGHCTGKHWAGKGG